MLSRFRPTTLMALTVALAASVAPCHATLLADYFGVNPTVTLVENWQYTSGSYYTAYRLDASSLAPTRHTASTDFQTNDWFGRWTNQVATGVYDYPGTGTRPAGEEPYDVEAYYFDNDDTNLYFVMIVGFPSPANGLYQETRISGSPVVAHGDFALDVPRQSGSPTDSWGFAYDYGVDLVDDDRPSSGNISAYATYTLGDQLYRTTTGWYVGTPNNAVNPITGNLSNAYTNFDPSYSGLTSLGGVTTAWYQLQLTYGGANVQENNWNTYAIEVTIPRSMLAALSDGDILSYQWLPGCRNDGSATGVYLTGGGRVDAPEPSTLALLLTAAPVGWAMRRRRRSVPAS